MTTVSPLAVVKRPQWNESRRATCNGTGSDNAARGMSPPSFLFWQYQPANSDIAAGSFSSCPAASVCQPLSAEGRRLLCVSTEHAGPEEGAISTAQLSSCCARTNCGAGFGRKWSRCISPTLCEGGSRCQYLPGSDAGVAHTTQTEAVSQSRNERLAQFRDSMLCLAEHKA